MTIYHYTSIQTLALILKYKKIRFNRLDLVDDLEESMYGSGPSQSRLSQYHFVSCWTKDEHENLALWNMYTRYKGVRIGLDEMPFLTYRVNDKFYSFFDSYKGFENDYFYSSFINEAKLYDVKYVDNPSEKIQELIQPSGKGFFINTEEVGIYKRKEWAMQKESRFKVNVMPINSDSLEPESSYFKKNPLNYEVKLVESIGPSISQSKPIQITHIDLDLDPLKLQTIEITLGPLTTEADRYIVESLLSPYPKSTIKDSFFLGKLREKA